MSVSKADLSYCKTIQKQHGKSYFFATNFFPKHMREATYVLYAFFRIPDNIVDHQNENTDAEKQLHDWLANWKMAYKTQESDQPALRAAAAIHRRYKIPFEYSEQFLQAMIQDLTKTRYDSYDELCQYMDGSAAAVGVMMSYVIGFSDPAALTYARDLGYAMQLTNFLRDISEDINERGRIYLPLDELRLAGVSEDQIIQHHFDTVFQQMIINQADRARSLYRSAEKGIPLLSKEGRFAVQAAATLYEAILDELEAQNWNPFAGRARTSSIHKLSLLPTIWTKSR